MNKLACTQTGKTNLFEAEYIKAMMFVSQIYQNIANRVSVTPNKLCQVAFTRYDEPSLGHTVAIRHTNQLNNYYSKFVLGICTLWINCTLLAFSAGWYYPDSGVTLQGYAKWLDEIIIQNSIKITRDVSVPQQVWLPYFTTTAQQAWTQYKLPRHVYELQEKVQWIKDLVKRPVTSTSRSGLL